MWEVDRFLADYSRLVSFSLENSLDNLSTCSLLREPGGFFIGSNFTLSLFLSRYLFKSIDQL